MKNGFLKIRLHQKSYYSHYLIEKSSRLILMQDQNRGMPVLSNYSCKNYFRWKMNSITSLLFMFLVSFYIKNIISNEVLKESFCNSIRIYFSNTKNKSDHKFEPVQPFDPTIRSLIHSSITPTFTSFLPIWHNSSLRDDMHNIIEPDYGGLNITYKRNGVPRTIRSDITYEETIGHHLFHRNNDIEEDDLLLGEDEYILEYFAFDDDTVHKKNCQKPSWYGLKFPLCNVVHEKDMLGVGDDATLVTNGFYRDVWTLSDERVMLKTLRYEHTINLDNVAMIDVDVLIMERLTVSPRISNVFAHCGTSVLVERFNGITIGNLFMEEERNGIKYPIQTPNPGQKLQMALQMAEGIADLHGFIDGVIVHNDIQYPQFLTDSSLNVYLTDFNRAEIMFWDKSKSHYCKFFSGFAHGNVRSPEEYANKLVDEKIDVYSFGNVLYSLLSGNEPYDDISDDLLLSDTIVKGILPKISDSVKNHSFAESILLEIMQKCFTYNPENRISIFDVVELLRKSVDLYNNFEDLYFVTP